MDILPKSTTNQPEGGAKNNAAEKLSGFSSVKANLKLPQLKIIGESMQDARWTVILSILILCATLLAWSGFFFYNKSFVNQKEGLEKRAEELNTKENQEMTQKILDLENDLKTGKKILNSHIYSSQSLKFVESFTLPNVRLLDFQLDAKTGQISASGLAQTYSVLAKQILVLEKQQKEVKSVKVSGVALNQLGGVGFKMEIILNQNIFSKNEQ